jgi:hypothetical protein
VRLKRSLAYTPTRVGLPRSSSLKSWLLRLPSLTILGPPSAQSSFACHQRYSCQGGVQHHLEGHYSFFIAHTSSCAKPAPSSEFVYPHFIRRSLQVAASPCWEPGSSRRYLRNSFLRCLVLNPDGPTECTCLFLPRRHRPSLDPSQVGLPFYPRTRFFFRGEVSRLSSDISYVQASEFACLPDRSHRCIFCRAAETSTSGQNVLRYLCTHRICYPPDTGN